MTDTDELIRRLALLLDACQEIADAAAGAEKRREAGKPMRQTTWQNRAEAMRETITEANDYLENKP